MSHSEANERIRMRTYPAMRGETIHPVHEGHRSLSGQDGIATGKEMYRRFYGKNLP